MSHQPLSVDKILKIRDRLPHGSQIKIAKKTGKSATAVWEVLQGEYYNADIIEAALSIIEEQNKKVTAQSRRVEKLLKG